MAKKNSTKTATKEAMAASEPRVLNFGQWTGINFKEAPLGWNPLKPAYKNDSHGQSDLPDNYLMLQNNVVTTSLKALETRLDTLPVCTPPAHPQAASGYFYEFTGICHLFEDRLFVALKTARHVDGHKIYPQQNEDLYYYVLAKNPPEVEWPYDPQQWHPVKITDNNGLNQDDKSWITISDIYVYAETLIVTTKRMIMVNEPEEHIGEIFAGPLETIDSKGVWSSRKVPDPDEYSKVIANAHGDLVLSDTENDDATCRITFVFCYTNRFGSTLVSPPSTYYANFNPVEFSSYRYIQLHSGIDGSKYSNTDIDGVDIYCTLNENQDYIFIGHAVCGPTWQTWAFSWFGAMQDTSQWSHVQLTTPTSNDTMGVDATMVDCHDGRLYFYGGTLQNRLYIGGDPGSELSVARGLGGAFVDLDPGTGLVINSTHKFKTYNGASIVTIMCGNRNTNAVKRFNLLETNLTVTNELQSKGYEAEEVPNVIGCNSPWGAGVFENGLYALSRYGLGITTMQMEESNTLQVQYLSDAIQPIFTERVADQLKNVRMMYVDGVIYFALSVLGTDAGYADEHIGERQALDKIIFCYDIAQKAWYTLSYEVPDEVEILHLFNFDYESWWEGIGIITANRIDRIPVTGPHSETAPEFTALIETGELGLRIPPQIYVWLAQLEFRFDYIVGELDIEVFGTDYYGREYRVYHHVDTGGKLLYEYPVWMRIDKNVETYRVRIKGNAHFRMSHFMSKTYQQSDKMKLVYGYDSHADYQGRHGKLVDDHHYLDSYNNLRKAIVT